MNSFNTKYKDKKPEETINNIQNFFKNNNYIIKEVFNQKSIIGTWSVAYELIHHDELILTSNGKGISQIYAQASGLSELYERFCNKMPFLLNPIFSENYTNNNYLNYGYYLDEKEKQLSYTDIKNSYYYPLLQEILPDKELEEYLTINCPNGFIGVPYISIDNPIDIKYYDPRILYKLNISTGMATGNTIEEALNQGLSEIFERYVSELLFKIKEEKYFCLQSKDIKNLKLRELVENIQKQHNFYLFDLSYNFGVPVLLGVIFTEDCKILASLGSFPIFDIALERVITESYQGIYDFENKNNLQIPFNDMVWYEAQSLYGNSYINCPFFPEEILDKIQYVNNYNEKVFINKQNLSNVEILQYYKYLSQNLNIKFYYKDNSLNSNIKSIHIFSDDFFPLTGNINFTKDLPIENKIKYFYFYKFKYLTIKNILNNNFNYNIFAEQCKVFEDLDNEENFNKFLSVLFKIDYFVPYTPTDQLDKTFTLIVYIINNVPPQLILNLAYPSFYFLKLKKYFTLLSYCKNKIYTNTQIKQLFKNFNYTITDIDIKNNFNKEYLIYNIFITPIIEEINSKNYLEILNSMSLQGKKI